MNAIVKFAGLIERHVQPISKRLERQPHVSAIRDGFVLLIPFLTVGSFIMVFLIPPFPADTESGFGQAWLAVAGRSADSLWRVFQMTFDVMALLASASIAYHLAKAYDREPLPAAMLAMVAFMIVAAPFADNTIATVYLGGRGLFAAIFLAVYTVEVSRLLDRFGITIRLPESVPNSVAASFNVLIPLVVVIATVLPVVVWLESAFGTPVPQIIMNGLAPIVAASDSLAAVLLVVFATHLLWFVGINGSLVLMSLWTPFLLTNMTQNLQSVRDETPLEFVVTNGFWDFYIVHGATGGLLALAILLVRSRSVQMRSIGRIGIVPAFFSIGEPIVYGLPIVMNPLMLIPLVFCPAINAVIAYFFVSADLIGKMFIMVPWTTPAPIGAFLSTGGDIRAALLSAGLIVVDIVIYYPFFKALEKQYVAREALTPKPIRAAPE